MGLFGGLLKKHIDKVAKKRGWEPDVDHTKMPWYDPEFDSIDALHPAYLAREERIKNQADQYMGELAFKGAGAGLLGYLALRSDDSEAGMGRGLLPVARRGWELLTEDEITQLNKAMDGIDGFEPIRGQNDIIPVTVDLARELVGDAHHSIKGRMGGPMSSGDEYAAWKQHIKMLELLESPLLNTGKK